MNRIITTLLLSVIIISGLFIDSIFAVSASPDPIEISQSDGTTIKVKIKGDEFYHWFEDNNGYTILKDTQTKSWVYATKNSDGRLEKTDKLVGKISVDSLGMDKSIKDDIILNNAKQKSKRYTSNLQTKFSSQKIISSTGTIKNLVVLVEFSNKNMEFAKSEIYDLFNKTNYTTGNAVGSVKDFFKEVSYNTCNIESVVSDVVTLDYGYGYYGANSISGDDIRPREMVEEALSKLNSTGFDFAQADGNGDGWVDMLTIVHAGCGEEASSDENNIWSHRWEIESTFTADDGTKMYEYMTVPERRNSEGSTKGLIRIGVICHELGHLFYMTDLDIYVPDLYDTTNNDSAGLGDFCLMASGSWNGSSGNRPAHPCAWIKYRLGWITPQTLKGGTNAIGTSAASKTAFYKFAGITFNTKEYFLMENRQRVGFDASLPGMQRGILIYHIDENKTNNNDRNHYLVDLEEADGTSIWTNDHLANNANSGLDSDYYRSNTLTVFNDDCTSSPNSKSYTNQTSSIDISQISASGSTMTFFVAEEENYETFINTLTDDKGLKFLNFIMKYTIDKTKTQLKELLPTDQEKIHQYFTFTTTGAQEADAMYDIYNAYNNNQKIYGISKNKTGIVSAYQANLINKLSYNLATSLQTITSVGNISNQDNQPTQQETSTNSTITRRFTGTEAIINIQTYKENLGYLLYKFNSMVFDNEYDILEITPSTDISIYSDYVYVNGAESVSFDNLSKVISYPNPSRNGEINFINLPTDVTKLDIQIFTITSRPVKSFTVNDTEIIANGNRKLKWNCKNQYGDNVAPGVYLVLFKTSSEKKTIKIAIIR